MRTALLPGSYDPITKGHLDIIRRAAALYDKVTVLVAKNENKNYMLCTKSRVALAEDAVKDIPGVTVDEFDGMLVDYIVSHGKPVIVKGLRNSADFTYEQNMAFYNYELSSRKYGFAAETVFLNSRPEFAEISSSLVRTLIGFGADYSDLVPNAELLKELLKQ